jgi:hypothetical protein
MNFRMDPAGLVLDPPGDGEGGEDGDQVRFDGVPLVVVDGPGRRSLLAIRNVSSI